MCIFFFNSINFVPVPILLRLFVLLLKLFSDSGGESLRIFNLITYFTRNLLEFFPLWSNTKEVGIFQLVKLKWNFLFRKYFSVNYNCKVLYSLQKFENISVLFYFSVIFSLDWIIFKFVSVTGSVRSWNPWNSWSVAWRFWIQKLNSLLNFLKVFF